jgi:hypothetical protein
VLFRVSLIFSLLAIHSLLYSHPGRTDRYGCHTCRTNCTQWGLSYGQYHCHRPKLQDKSESLEDEESVVVPKDSHFDSGISSDVSRKLNSLPTKNKP